MHRRPNAAVFMHRATTHADSGKSTKAQVDVSGFTDVVPDEDGGFDEAVGEALGKWEKSPKK
jgi:hypothetical protein